MISRVIDFKEENLISNDSNHKTILASLFVTSVKLIRDLSCVMGVDNKPI